MLFYLGRSMDPFCHQERQKRIHGSSGSWKNSRKYQNLFELSFVWYMQVLETKASRSSVDIIRISLKESLVDRGRISQRRQFLGRSSDRWSYLIGSSKWMILLTMRNFASMIMMWKLSGQRNLHYTQWCSDYVRRYLTLTLEFRCISMWLSSNVIFVL